MAGFILTFSIFHSLTMQIPRSSTDAKMCTSFTARASTRTPDSSSFSSFPQPMDFNSGALPILEQASAIIDIAESPSKRQIRQDMNSRYISCASSVRMSLSPPPVKRRQEKEYCTSQNLELLVDSFPSLDDHNNNHQEGFGGLLPEPVDVRDDLSFARRFKMKRTSAKTSFSSPSNVLDGIRL